MSTTRPPRRVPADRGRGRELTITVDGTPVTCYAGETVATALLAAGVSRFRTAADGSPRGPLCNMGTCFECALTVDGAALTRACLVPVAPGMVVETARDV